MGTSGAKDETPLYIYSIVVAIVSMVRITILAKIEIYVS